MTLAEYEAHWDNYWDLFIEGKQVEHWPQNDGHNDIRLKGEDFYRVVVIKPKPPA